MRLQDLFLILSQCVDLGLLSITAAFRASRDNVLRSRPRRRSRPRIRPPQSVAPSGIAPTYRVGDLEEILGSGFEMIWISQGESPRVFGFMIKKGQIGDQIQDHNRGGLQYHPRASRVGNPRSSDSVPAGASEFRNNAARYCFRSHQIPYHRQHGHLSSTELTVPMVLIRK
jgi:hypothetical protein